MAYCPSAFSRPGPPSFSGVCTGPSCRGVGEVSLVPPHTPPNGSLYPCLIAARTFLHAARSAFHVAVVCLVLHCRRASRFLSSAVKSTALTAGRSHHPSLRGIRLISGRTAYAARRMASVNSLASSAALARWPDVSSIDEFPDHVLPEELRLQLASVEWPGLRCLLYTAVVGKSPPTIHSGKYHVVIRVRFDGPIWLRVYFYVVYSRPVCLAC